MLNDFDEARRYDSTVLDTRGWRAPTRTPRIRRCDARTLVDANAPARPWDAVPADWTAVGGTAGCGGCLAQAAIDAATAANAIAIIDSLLAARLGKIRHVTLAAPAGIDRYSIGGNGE
jgi:hypothetical protein